MNYLSLTILCYLWGSALLFAQDLQGQKCAQEIKNLCGGLPHEIEREKLISCMKEKGSQLSSECQKRPSDRGNMQGQDKEENRPSSKCLEEIKSLCGGLPHEIGKEKFISCMKEKSSQLSSECQKKPNSKSN